MIQGIKKRIKQALIHRLTHAFSESVEENLLERYIAECGITNYFNFNFGKQKEKTLSFVNEMSCSDGHIYKYAPSCHKPNIYSSTYACLLLSLYGEIDKLSENEKLNWISYFDSFQKADGFFYDESICNEIYDNTDWWGKRHLLPHIIMAYTALGTKPKYEFTWLKDCYSPHKLDELIANVNWNSAIMDDTDIDNKIMNIGVCLQYQRDFRNDEEADAAIKYLKEKLLERINPATGFWGNYNLSNKAELARMIQFSYHLQRLFFYDKYKFLNAERMIDLILKSQNAYGGFAVQLNSSACADIDAINPLIYLSKETDYRKKEIEAALQRAFIFVLSNQNPDGGFVFKRDAPFYYGANEMSSQKNESAMFPTWFRTLCLAYMCDYLNCGSFNIIKCPGY